jgi:hypothetical protein
MSAISFENAMKPRYSRRRIAAPHRAKQHLRHLTRMKAELLPGKEDVAASTEDWVRLESCDDGCGDFWPVCSGPCLEAAALMQGVVMRKPLRRRFALSFQFSDQGLVTHLSPL